MKQLLHKHSNLYQIVRYGIVGVVNNLVGYLIYLIVTFFWLEPKVAITLFYPVGAAIGYYSHSKYSFSQESRNIMMAVRYTITYLLGYGINFMMLTIFADKLAFPHQEIQALSIPVVAIFLFLMLKYFVFPPNIKCSRSLTA